MANLSQVIKLTSEQYSTLVSTGSITVGGVTYNYDANAIYLVDGVNTVANLYSHYIRFYIKSTGGNEECAVTAYVVNSSSTPFTAQTFVNFINANFPLNHYFPVTGFMFNTSSQSGEVEDIVEYFTYGGSGYINMGCTEFNAPQYGGYVTVYALQPSNGWYIHTITDTVVVI